MPEYTITLKRLFRIPPGFAVAATVIDGETTHHLVRQIDDRRARIIWEDGEGSYTAQWLSSHMLKEADYDDPRLKGFV